MEVRACYEEMGSNFDEVLSRLGSEQMVQRFAIKFLNDKSYETLEAALKEKDVEVLPIYIPGLLRTACKPSRIWI